MTRYLNRFDLDKSLPFNMHFFPVKVGVEKLKLSFVQKYVGLLSVKENRNLPLNILDKFYSIISVLVFYFTSVLIGLTDNVGNFYFSSSVYIS